jgi:hypothetical protein
MASATQYTIGAEVSDAEGPLGEVTRIVVDPADRRMTHLVIEPKHRFGLGRLVPADLTEVTDGRIRLLCDHASFESLPSAEDVFFGQGADDFPGEGLVEPVVTDTLPGGEVALRQGDPVHALDGEVGQVEGVLTEGPDRSVTHVLLREGHLLRHRDVAIPMSAVTSLIGGIRLDLTKQQLEELAHLP